VLDMENMFEMPLLGNELPADSNPLLPFSPETARIRLPSPMSAEVAELVSAYEREKSVLKQELTDLLFAADDAFLSILRTTKLEQLARSQAPRFDQVEILAERIRQALAASDFRPTLPRLPSIPPEIETRLDDYSAQQESVSRNVMRTVAHFQDIADIDQVAVRPTDNGRFEVSISVRRGADQQAQMELIKGKLEEFNAAHARRMVDLERERLALVNAVKWLITKGEGPEADRDAERLIATYMQAKEQRERLSRYRDYQVATLEPGLSPEQRRLLFSAGLVGLELPLPAATFSPTTAFNARARAPRRESLEPSMGSRQGSSDLLATPGRND
jgi:putative lipoic acid-binding regulatory protein